MFEPQGGSLYTDETMTTHVHRFCCLIPGLEEKTKACNRDRTQISERTQYSGVFKLLCKLKKLKILTVSNHSMRLTVHKPQHIFVKFTFI